MPPLLHHPDLHATPSVSHYQCSSIFFHPHPWSWFCSCPLLHSPQSACNCASTPKSCSFPKKCLYLPHPPECWCQQSVRASPGHDAAATRRFWWNASQAYKGQVTPISSTSIGLLTKFPFKGFSRGWITQGSQIRSQAQAARFWRVCSAGRWQRIQVENHNGFPQTMHFARANMQSWSVKSLLHFVVCFIVWMGEYHTLAVAPLYILFPYSTQFFGVLCLLYPSLLITRCLLSKKIILALS